MITVKLTNEEFEILRQDLRNKELTLHNEIRLSNMAIEQAQHYGSSNECERQEKWKKRTEIELESISKLLKKFISKI